MDQGNWVQMKMGSELHQVIKFPVCPWSSFYFLFFFFFLSGTSPLRMKEGTEIARNLKPLSSLPPLHDGPSPEVLSQPSRFEVGG